MSYLASPPPSPRPFKAPQTSKPTLPVAVKSKSKKHLSRKSHHSGTKEKVLSLEEQAQAAKTASILARRELKRNRPKLDNLERYESLSAPALARQDAVWEIERQAMRKESERIKRELQVMKEEDDRAWAEWVRKTREDEARTQVKMAELGISLPPFYLDDPAYQI